MSERKNTIGKNHYTLILPPVRQAMAICTKVAVLVSSAMPLLLSETTEAGRQELSTAIAAIDPEKLDALFMEASNASRLTCDGKLISTDLVFAQHFDDCRGNVYPVMLWVLWECVRDFFPQAETFVQNMSTVFGKASPFLKDGKPTTG